MAKSEYTPRHAKVRQSDNGSPGYRQTMVLRPVDSGAPCKKPLKRRGMPRWRKMRRVIRFHVYRLKHSWGS